MTLIAGVLLGIAIGILLVFGSYIIWLAKWVVLAMLCLLGAIFFLTMWSKR